MQTTLEKPKINSQPKTLIKLPWQSYGDRSKKAESKKRLTLPEAEVRLAETQARAKALGIQFPVYEGRTTLDKVQTELARLEKEIRSASAASKVIPPQLSKPIDRGSPEPEPLPALQQPAVVTKPAVTKPAPNPAEIVAPGTLSELKAALDAQPDLNARLRLFKTAETNLRAAIKREPDQIKVVPLQRALQKVQKYEAVQLFSDPAAWKKRHQMSEEL